MKRLSILLPWALTVILALAGLWAFRERSAEKERSTSMILLADSLRSQLDEASIARFQADRQREFADNYLKNLLANNEDLKRVYEMEKAASDEAIAQTVEAQRQTLAKEKALQSEQVARAEEQQQRRIADARADSITLEQQRTDRANRRLQASKLAQNSMAVKGEPQVRGLMAVYAARSMEQAGGDVNKDELVRALQGALDELERGAPPGVDRLGAGSRTMVLEGGEVLALGNDGVLLSVDHATWKKRVIADLSERTGRTGGRAFLSAGTVLTANLERAIAVCSARDGSLIASEERTPHTEDITAMAAFPDNTVIASGDRGGNVVVWSQDGSKLRVVQQHKFGGTIRTMITEPRSGMIVAINGTDKIRIIAKDGTATPISLSDAERAHSIAPGGNGEVLIGTHHGSIVALNVASREFRRVHAGNGQRVETIAVEGGDGRHIAFVDAVRILTVLDRKENSSSPYRSSLSGIPNVIAFGRSDVLYLAFDDRTIRRAFTSTTALADRLCALIGRTWTADEWKQHIGEGSPEPTCSHLP